MSRHLTNRVVPPVLCLFGMFPFLVSCGDGGGNGGTGSKPQTPVATTVTVTPSSATLNAVGATQQFSVTVRDQNGQVMASASVSWNSSSASVASITSGGLATATGNGTTTITASSGSASGTASLSVSQVVASVTVTPGVVTLIAQGETVQLSAQAIDSNGNLVQGAAFTWNTSDPNCVQVNSNGLATSGQPGVARVTATSSGVTGTATITVVPPPVATVEVAPAQESILIGATVQLTATTKDASGNILNGRTVTWLSGNAAVASVDANGLVTAVAVGGPVTITATSEGKNGTAQITVLPIPVATVEVSPAAGSIITGQTIQLTAVTKDAGGNVLTGRTVNWASSAPAVASVNAIGLVTGISSGGPVTITATSEGKSGQAQVTVLAPVATVVINGALRVKVGDTYTYTTTARLADGTIVVRPVVWSILEGNKGVMTPDGHLSPLQTGLITLQAEIDGVVWTGFTTAYDWTTLSGSGSLFVFLDADVQITNKWGTSEYPELVFSCNTGTGNFFAWVDTEHFVTANGLVTYSLDGVFYNQTWIEFDNFSALGHPGPTNLQTKNFAIVVSLARQFGFAFTEFNGPAKATIFRVTGLAPLLAPLITACPSNAAPPEAVSAQREIWSELHGHLVSTELSPELVSARNLRRQVGPEPSQFPNLVIPATKIETQIALKRR